MKKISRVFLILSGVCGLLLSLAVSGFGLLMVSLPAIYVIVFAILIGTGVIPLSLVQYDSLGRLTETWNFGLIIGLVIGLIIILLIAFLVGGSSLLGSLIMFIGAIIALVGCKKGKSPKLHTASCVFGGFTIGAGIVIVLVGIYSGLFYITIPTMAICVCLILVGSGYILGGALGYSSDKLSDRIVVQTDVVSIQ